MVRNTENYSFDQLTETLYKNIKEVKEKDVIKENLKKRKAYYDDISHLYLGISRNASDILVEHEKNKKKLEDAYSNLLKLISKTLELEPMLRTMVDGTIIKADQEKQTEHLWRNRELLDETMSHYVRQIKMLREKRRTMIEVIISIILIGLTTVTLILSILKII